jgi:hypothetical protein
MINYDLIGQGLLHPIAANILAAYEFHAGRKLSPNELSAITDEALGNVSYHVSMLSGRHPNSRFKENPVLELVDTQPRRGAVEHYYALSDAAKLTPAVLRDQLDRLRNGELDAAEGEGRR